MTEQELQAYIQAIAPADRAAMDAAEKRQAELAKPPGSLGELETISVRLAGITGQVCPAMDKCRVAVFAADNGVVDEGVSCAPRSVTRQQAVNMTRHVTGMSSLAACFGDQVAVVDVGMEQDPHCDAILDRHIRRTTGNITRDLHQALLARGHRSAVLYGRGPLSADPHVARICPSWYGRAQGLTARVAGLPYGRCIRSTRHLLDRIHRIGPDVVHLQCLNGHFCNLYLLLEDLKQSGIPTVLTLHAEFPYTGGCSHAGPCSGWKEHCGVCVRTTPETTCLLGNRTAAGWRRLRGIYEGWNRLTVVGCSRWIARRAAASSALSGIPVTVIANGIDTTVFRPRRQEAADLHRALSIPPEERVVLFAAPAFSREKGFDLFLELARSCRGLPLRFLAAGGRCTGGPDNLTVLGHVSGREYMAVLYTAADALVLCSRQDNFPTVCLEAAACGTPVVGFSVGGVAETILPGLGTAVPPGDIPSMQRALLELPSPLPAAVERARVLWDCQRMAEDYLALYRAITRQEVL